MIVHKEYRYDITVELMYKNKLIKLRPMYIKSLYITYNYEKYNMPIPMLHLQTDMKIKNSIVNNFITKTNDFVNLSIEKYIYDEKEEDLNYSSPMKTKSRVLFKRFNYILESSENSVNKQLEYDESQDKDDVEDITIGLIDFDLFKKNKIKINTVVRNSSLKSLLLYYLSKYKILIEPFNDFEIDQFIIPPMESITELIQYIFNYYCIYNTGYTLFHDFEKSYFISKSGNLIKCKGDNITTFNLEYNNNEQAIYKKTSGMYYKDNNIGVLIFANKNDLSINEISNEKDLGKIGVIGSNGKYKEVEIYENDSIKIYKINTPNVDIVDIYKYNILLNNKIIEVSKSGLDTGEFTINKEYNIINNDTNEVLRGLLVEKVDMFLHVKEDFVLNTTMRFKIIPE